MQNLFGRRSMVSLPGTYRGTAYVVAQIYNNTSRKGQCGKGAFLFAGDEKVEITSNKWQELSVVCTVGASPTLRIGILGGSNNENDWVSIANVRVECIGYAGYSNLREVVLDDKMDVSLARESRTACFTLFKTLFTTKYTPIYLPFDIAESKAGEMFDDILEVKGVKTTQDGAALTTATAKEIKAGKPYLFKGKADGRQRLDIGDAVVNMPLTTPTKVVLSSGAYQVVGTYRLTEGLEEILLPDTDGIKLVAQSTGRVAGYSFWIIKKQ